MHRLGIRQSEASPTRMNTVRDSQDSEPPSSQPTALKPQTPDHAPVDAADNGQQQQNLFEYGHKNPSLYASMAQWGGIYS